MAEHPDFGGFSGSLKSCEVAREADLVRMDDPMKSVLAFLLLLAPAIIFADFKLEPEYAPHADFPIEHFDGQRKVLAKVSYTVSNNGSVSDVEIESATNPKFGESVRKVMMLWRFKPWPLEGNPETVRYESVFVRSLDMGLYQAYKKKVGRLRCSQLNEEVAKFRTQHPGKALREMPLFTETLIALGLVSIIPEQEFTHEQSMRWSTVLGGAFPRAIGVCQKNPDGTYLNALPQSLSSRFKA
jgi:TonB family protein